MILEMIEKLGSSSPGLPLLDFPSVLLGRPHKSLMPCSSVEHDLKRCSQRLPENGLMAPVLPPAWSPAPLAGSLPIAACHEQAAEEALGHTCCLCPSEGRCLVAAHSIASATTEKQKLRCCQRPSPAGALASLAAFGAFAPSVSYGSCQVASSGVTEEGLQA